MKCHACGYTDDAALPEAQEVKAAQKQRPIMFAYIGCTFPMEKSGKKGFDLYACPHCGTVRMKLQNEPE